MDPVSTIRAVLGLTQRQLAASAKTSQPTVAAYEAGTKSPTWRTIERLADVNGVACLPCVAEPMTRDQRRSLHLHEAIARRLHDDPDPVIGRARRNLVTMRRRHPHAAALLGEWELILRADVRRIVMRMLDPSDHGRELRAVTPFAGVLDAPQRAAVYRSFRSTA